MVRQVGYVNQVVAAEHKSSFNFILQLTDIAGPIVRHQQRERLRGNAGDASALQPVEAGDELLHQQRDVLLAAAQRRQFHAHDVDAIVKILTKNAEAYLLHQIFVRGHQNSYIHTLRTRRAQGFKRTFL